MRVNPYIEPLLQNATDLTNSPPVSAVDLDRRWLAWGLIPSPRPVVGNDLALARRFLRQWIAMVDAPDTRSRVARLNELLHRYAARPSITDHDGSGWHLHYRDPAASFGATLAGATSAAAAQFLCDRGMHRLGRCELVDCRSAFVDFSRPGRQRFCTHACGNRAAVRRHRVRAGGPA